MTTSSASASAWERRSVEVGEWRVTALSDGFFRLDGGSMWGVVPANLWRKLTPPAEDNTIRLGLRPFLLERGDVKAIVEVGVGDRWEAAELRGIVVNAKMMFDGTIMPAFYIDSGYERPLKKFDGKSILTAQQVEDVVAYLLTLKD